MLPNYDIEIPNPSGERWSLKILALAPARFSQAWRQSHGQEFQIWFRFWVLGFRGLGSMHLGFNGLGFQGSVVAGFRV